MVKVLQVGLARRAGFKSCRHDRHAATVVAIDLVLKGFAGAGFEAANELVDSWAVSKQFSATGPSLKNPRRPLPNWQDSELLKD
jgi:hypothetical protein